MLADADDLSGFSRMDDVWCTISCKWMLFGSLYFPESGEHTSVVYSESNVLSYG
jgi:hypothetical protein